MKEITGMITILALVVILFIVKHERIPPTELHHYNGSVIIDELDFLNTWTIQDSTEIKIIRVYAINYYQYQIGDTIHITPPQNW